MTINNDLEKRAEQIREELSDEDKTNLVAKAIIELVKEKKSYIIFKDITCKIQDYFSLPYSSPYYIIYFQGNHISSVGYYVEKLYRECFKKYNIFSIDFAVLNSTMPHFGDRSFDDLDKLTKIKNKRNNDTEKYYRKVVVEKICNGDYDFLLKPIPILEKIKVEKSIDEDIKNIEEEINHNNDIPEEDKKDATEITIELRIPLGKMKNDVLKRANGECECCKDKEMTFEKEDGEKYFEIHHIKHYSDCKKEGINPNTLDNLAVLCPRCHKQIHFGKKEIVKNMEEKLKEKIKNNCK